MGRVTVGKRGKGREWGLDGIQQAELVTSSMANIVMIGSPAHLPDTLSEMGNSRRAVVSGLQRGSAAST